MKFNKPPVEGEIVGDYGAIFIEQTQWRYQPCGRRNRYGLFKYWMCQCDCGNTTTISSADFTKTKSCGCLLFHSFGEQATKEILEENNVEYMSQYSFDDCNSDFNAPLRFDFYLPKDNCCIEIDGRQHFTPVSRFGGEKAFERLQKNDKIKNNYCVKNNIKMIRIKYNRELNIKEIIYKTLVKNGVINE